MSEKIAARSEGRGHFPCGASPPAFRLAPPRQPTFLRVWPLERPLCIQSKHLNARKRPIVVMSVLLPPSNPPRKWRWAETGTAWLLQPFSSSISHVGPFAYGLLPIKARTRAWKHECEKVSRKSMQPP